MTDQKSKAGRKPEIRPPRFLTDLYRDLRDQRLLPLVILLLVAIPVVPFLLSDPTPTFVPPAEDEGLSATITDTSLMVVSAPSGLRRHGERFSDRAPRDPFLDPNAPEPAAEAQGGGAAPAAGGGASAADGAGGDPDTPTSDGGSGGGGASSGQNEPSQPAGPADPGGSDRPGGSGAGSDAGPDSLTLFRMKTTLRFGRAGSGLLHTFDDIDRMRGLPRNDPIAIFIGASDDGKRAIFSISADASMVRGQGSCSSGRPKYCQFLTLRPGQGANIHDARRNVVWRLAVRSIELVESEVQADRKADRADRAGENRPVAEPTDPDVVQAASLSEVIGLYLLK